MSMSRGCLFVERYPGKWFGVIAHHEYDYDFQRGYKVYGPKPSMDEIIQFVLNRESNPGGYETAEYNQLSPRDIALVDRKE